jgi:hypothetical protein
MAVTPTASVFSLRAFSVRVAHDQALISVRGRAGAAGARVIAGNLARSVARGFARRQPSRAGQRRLSRGARGSARRGSGGSCSARRGSGGSCSARRGSGNCPPSSTRIARARGAGTRIMRVERAPATSDGEWHSASERYDKQKGRGSHRALSSNCRASLATLEVPGNTGNSSGAWHRCAKPPDAQGEAGSASS